MAVLDVAREVAPRSAARGVDSGEASDAKQGPVRDLRGAVRLCAGTGVLAVGLFWLVRGALIDDAYISLSYARNVATHLHWGLIPTEAANSATSPLNVLVLAGATTLRRPFGGIDPIAGLALVVVGCAVAMAWWWGRAAATLRLPLLAPVLGLALVLLNPFVLSAIGLEVLLIPAVLVGLLAAAVGGQPVGFGGLAGLAVLTRLDLVVFVVPLALSSAALRRRLPTAVGMATAVALPWFAWSWWFFGSAIPDTFAIKTVQRSFGPWTFGNGPLLYLERDALATWVAFAPALAGVLALAVWGVARLRGRGTVRAELAPAVALGAGGIAYYAVSMLLGVPPYQWYYVPSLVALSTSLCVLVGAALRGNRVWRRAVALPAVALVVLLTIGNGVADVRGGMPWRVPVIFGNWATPGDYATAGKGLGDRIGAATVVSPGEIGTLAYFCECSIVDAFADRGSAVPLIEAWLAAAGPVVGALLDLNYRRLDHDRPPRPAQFRLVWEPRPADGPDQWQTWSPASGVGRLRLEALPPG